MTADRSSPRIVVLGSLNMDLVMRVARMPAPGETMAGLDFRTSPGGKGANQAVACARLGAEVTMVGRVGDDAFGRALRDGLAGDGVDVALVGVDTAPTGVAMILLEAAGENRIMLVAGANGALSAKDVAAARPSIDTARLLLLQMEVPLTVVTAAIDAGVAAGVPVLLNPAPAHRLPPEYWRKVDTLVPNEGEAGVLSGLAVHDPHSAAAAAATLRGWGVRQVVVTLGARGIVIVDAAGERHVPAMAAQVVDTTAAGDSFIGGLATGLAEGMTLDQAARLGQRAAAICVTRRGAQAAMPWRSELPADDLS